MGSQASNGTARFAGFELDLRTGELRKNGRRTRLQAQPLKALRVLLEHPGELVTREQLRKEVWPQDTFVDFDHGLNKAVAKLRDAVDEPDTSPSIIETLPRLGYRFIPSVEWVDKDRSSDIVSEPRSESQDEEANGESRPPVVEPSQVPRKADESPSSPWWKRKSIIAATVSLVVAALLYPVAMPEINRLWRLRELQQLKVVPLTSLPGNAYSPTFSPDGSQVAFAWDDGKGGNQSELYVKVIGTEKLLRLTNEPGIYHAAWSPNGQSIAIERVAANPAYYGVYLISPLAGPETKITDKCADPFAVLGTIAWSPDSKQLACVTYTSNTTSELLLLEVNSPQVVPLKTDCKRPILPAFSPDGIYLAWVCSDILGGSASIQLQRLGDDRSTQLLKVAEGIGRLAWSEDGRRLIFTAPFPSGDIWEVSLSSPNGPVKLPFGQDAFDVTVSSKGRRLAFAQRRTNVNIWRLDLGAAGHLARMVVASTREQFAPNISPEGDRIAFESNRGGSNEVWVSNADGSNAVQLSAFGIRLTGSPRWSPDGKLITFDSRVGGESNIYLVDPESRVPNKLGIDMHGNSQPSWSHDGKWIYFVNGEDAQHPTGWKVAPTGGHAVPIIDGPLMNPIESPDGSLLYFVRDSSLYSVRADGKTAGKVKGMPRVVIGGWTPVESGLYFIGFHTGRPAIEFFDLKTRGFRIVYVFEKPLPGWMGGLPVSRDGDWLLFPQQDEQSSSIMMVENWR